MVSALNVPGHRVQPASQQFSTVPQFAREVGVALQACLKDHKPGSLVYRSTVTMRNNFVKVPTQDSTHSSHSRVLILTSVLARPPRAICTFAPLGLQFLARTLFLTTEVVEERGKAFIYDHLVTVFSECILVPYNEHSHEEYTSTFLSSHDFEKRERGKAWDHQNTVYIF